MFRFSRVLLLAAIIAGFIARASIAEDNIAMVFTQVVKGNVADSKTSQPLVGATVRIMDTKLGAFTKADGSFKIEEVPVGRHMLQVSVIGYEPMVQSIVVTSGKEVNLNLQLNESFVRTEEVVVTSGKTSFTPVNEAAIVSSIEFSVDDAQRYAGSRQDPARMAQNFAGVLGASDTRNDIIIRGGSPTELLWRLDGLDIPNPNHFATQGATGGPVSAVNTMLLDNSDFLTGAFPAEYTDKMSGAFDLHTRKGNMDNYEHYGQFGFNGFELGTEGPMPGVKGSYIASYRYSFLDLFDRMGIDFGFSGIPRYQDGTVKMDFNLNDKNSLAVTSLFGTSDIYIKESETDDVYTGDFDIQNGTDIFTLGVNWKHLINDKSYGNLLAGTVFGRYRTQLDSLTTDEDNNVTDYTKWYTADSDEGYHTMKYQYHYSPSSRHYFEAGAESRYRYFKLDDRRFTVNTDEEGLYNVQSEGNTNQFMGYLNWNWRITEGLTANIGAASQYLELSEKITIEPRAALKWSFYPRHSVNIGFGVHTQSLPLLIYFANDANNSLDFMQSIHYVAGYSFLPAPDILIKLEGYFKDLSNVPVEAGEPSSWSFLNQGANFGNVFFDGALESKGTGQNYGLELTLMKNFSRGYYFTVTGSYGRQEYTGSDGVGRWGAFDNQYILNLLAGYEWVINDGFTIEFSGKYTLAGGKPYTPVDEVISAQRGTTYLDDSRAYSMRAPDYSRLDLKIDFRQNFKNVSIISYFSVENLLGNDNVLTYQWDNQNGRVEQVNQLGFFPVGGVRVEF